MKKIILFLIYRPTFQISLIFTFYKLSIDLKKLFFLRFSGRSRTFFRRETDFYEKEILHSAVCGDLMVIQMKIFVRQLFERSFSFWIKTLATSNV
jgi:hypothetical protein